MRDGSVPTTAAPVRFTRAGDVVADLAARYDEWQAATVATVDWRRWHLVDASLARFGLGERATHSALGVLVALDKGDDDAAIRFARLAIVLGGGFVDPDERIPSPEGVDFWDRRIGDRRSSVRRRVAS